MKFLLDKMETDEGRFLADWELDNRLDILREKYKFKTTILRDKNKINSEIHTIRITSMKQLQEFIEDFGDITITQDHGYYFDVGYPRIIIDNNIKEENQDEDIVETEKGYYDELGMYNRYKSFE